MRIKHFLPLSIAAVTFIGTLSIGCKKSNNSTSGSAFSATINDTTFTPAGNGTAAIYSAAYQEWYISSFQLKSKDTVSIDIQINAPFTVNQPITSIYNSSNILYYNLSGEPYYNPIGLGNTTITVTSWDSVNHKIAGTFSGNLYDNDGSGDSVIITNGKFNTSYLVQ